jgi:hypothetical protein
MGWATPDSPAVLLDKASHFTAPDGTDMLVAAGTYHVEQSAGTQLRLVADPPQPAVEIQATATTHEETVTSPLALAIAEEGQDDEIHLMLLLPDGQGLDATGTFSGTRSRGSREQPFNRLQMQHAMSQIQSLPQPPSYSPMLRVPPAAALLALPTWTNAAFEPPQQAGQIIGKVVNSCRPGDPSGIWVYILGRSFIVKTGTDGNFVLNYVPQGIHTLVLDLPPNPPQTIPNVTVSPSSVVDLGTQTIGSCGSSQTQRSCPAGSVLCAGGTCTNPGTDPRNCGHCGIVCQGQQQCVMGICQSAQIQTSCPAGSVLCAGGTCTNPGTDPRNCGRCGIVCQGQQQCIMGKCQ